MILAIVGDELSRWSGSFEAETWVRRRILEVFSKDTPECVVGALHPKTSVDLWALQEARKLGIPIKEHIPKGSNTVHLRACAMLVAEASHKLVCIAARNYPANHRGTRRGLCIYCSDEVVETNRHVYNNGCWTMRYAQQLKRETQLIVVGR